MPASWHALFAPLPVEAKLRREPIAGLAGWEQLSIDLSAGAAGLRHVMVVLDGGKPISASDWVLHMEGERYIHENVGGRIEPDGRFLGTRWRSVLRQKEGSDEAETLETVRSEPSAADIEGIHALVRELLTRSAGPPAGGASGESPG